MKVKPAQKATLLIHDLLPERVRNCTQPVNKKTKLMCSPSLKTCVLAVVFFFCKSIFLLPVQSEQNQLDKSVSV